MELYCIYGNSAKEMFEKKKSLNHFKIKNTEPSLNPVFYIYTKYFIVPVEMITSRPLKSIDKREVIHQWPLAYYFEQVQKNSHRSFEIISSRCQQDVYSIPHQSLVKVAA